MTGFTFQKAAALSYAGEREWRKGQPYVSSLTGLSAQPDGTVTMLRGSAYGQERYSVSATLERGQVQGAACSCPVGEDGRCKHVAALLARAVTSPADFRELPPLDAALDALDAPALRAVIRHMLSREPDLLSVLLTQSSTQSSAQPNTGQVQPDSADPASDLPGRIRVAFDLMDLPDEDHWHWKNDWDGPDFSELTPLLKELQKLVAAALAGDHAAQRSALAAIQATLDGCHDLNTQQPDLDDLSTLIEPAREALLSLLARPLPAALQGAALDTLHASVANLGWPDHEIDGQLDLFTELPAEDRAQTVAFVRGLHDSEAGTYDRQRRARTLYALASTGDLSVHENLALARATGDSFMITAALLDSGQPEEATALLAEHPELSLSVVAGLFQDSGALAHLEAFARTRPDPWARRWLFTHLYEQYRRAEAHAVARDALMQLPPAHADTPFWITQLKTVSSDWPADRETLITHWTARPDGPHLPPLVRLLLREHQPERAAQLLHGVPDPVGVLGLDLTRELALQLPAEQALALIIQVAAAHVAGRSRTHYQSAARTLRDAAPIIGRAEAQSAARLLTQEYPTLRALKEELQASGLL
ncbi:hypothetical protein GCM10008959_27700 [Deinococcus seoulensis]|uniref:SWIM-type domain-containing protein n=1 Tax=Deinococcus seoulensis TaxID=1837379 RepID=A0ABQ2RUR6_9DEIO|nr:hypothetical protein [Deinococcus seoulensis]GGR63998.1 hypothetical protein GCM10008959_27700 [Deinococcus seoulensis]